MMKYAVALVAVAVIAATILGSTSATKAAAGSIFVANEWSDITNENPAPAGFTSRGTVYSTFSESGRIIQSQADIVKVVVVDPNLNPSFPTTMSTGFVTAGGTSSGQTISGPIATTVTIALTGRGTSAPIAGSLADVQANTVLSVDGGTTNLVGNQLAIINFFAGSGIGDPWVQVVINVAGTYGLNHVTYNTSVPGSAVVTVKSNLETVGISVLTLETGIGSGRFEGWYRVVDSAVFEVGGDGQTIGAPKNIRASAGQLAFSFTDNESNNRETTVTVDKTAPTASITGPIDKSATQNTTPTFSGSISESGSGLRINAIDVRYDDSNDPTNAAAVVNTATGVDAGSSVSLAVDTTGALDGDSAFSFSRPPATGIPAGLANPDHIVDWVIKASDLAGNLGMSDADPSATGIQLPTVKIDKIIPSFTTTAADHLTGLATSSSGEVVARNSLRVAFNDDLTNVQASDFNVTLDSTAVISPTSVTVVNDTTGTFLKALSAGAESVVYLQFATDLVSNDTPRVSLQDTISDLAGNFTAQGDREVADGIAPVLSVTTSGGSGNGTGDEGPGQLTNQSMTIQITSDEPLAGAPAVSVFRLNEALAELAPTAIAQGANTWTATYVKPGTPPDGDRAIVVVATDTSANASLIGDVSTRSFTLDTALATPVFELPPWYTNTVPVPTPTFRIDYEGGGEMSAVTITEVLLDGVPIVGVPTITNGGRTFDYIPDAPLADGPHQIKILAGMASDAASNLSTVDQTLSFEVDSLLVFCSGLVATLFGTDGDDVISGTPGDDIIAGRDGNDTIDGRGGNDIICGDDGDDVLVGGVGNDWISGGRGDDIITGGLGNDVIRGNKGSDVLIGKSGRDKLYGAGGDDYMKGGSGRDELKCGAGIDIGDGGPGTDTFAGCETALN